VTFLGIHQDGDRNYRQSAWLKENHAI